MAQRAVTPRDSADDEIPWQIVRLFISISSTRRSRWFVNCKPPWRTHVVVNTFGCTRNAITGLLQRLLYVVDCVCRQLIGLQIVFLHFSTVPEPYFNLKKRRSKEASNCDLRFVTRLWSSSQICTLPLKGTTQSKDMCKLPAERPHPSATGYVRWSPIFKNL